MERIDLSTNSKKIQNAYDKVVLSKSPETFCILSVDKNSVVDVSQLEDGSLDDFADSFDDGAIEFGLARVTAPGSNVFKNLLVGWCPDNAPAKLRLSFATNFAEVSKVLSGYHVQITARDQDDLDVKEFLAKISAAAGAQYTNSSSVPSSSTKSSRTSVEKPIKPSMASSSSSEKPSSRSPNFTPKKPFPPTIGKQNVASSTKNGDDGEDDEWAGEKELVERDFEKEPLELVPSAYKPTKVNISELRNQKSQTISSNPDPKPKPQEEREDKKDSAPSASLDERKKEYEEHDDGRLTSLPKPHVGKSVLSRYSGDKPSGAPSFGSKPKVNAPGQKKNVTGGMSRDFGSTNGKSPAQLWAEKRGKFHDVKSDSDPSAIEDRVKSLGILNKTDNFAGTNDEKADELDEDERDVKNHEDDDGEIEAPSVDQRKQLFSHPSKPPTANTTKPNPVPLPPRLLTNDDDFDQSSSSDDNDDRPVSLIADELQKKTSSVTHSADQKADESPDTKKTEDPSENDLAEESAETKADSSQSNASGASPSGKSAVAEYDYEKEDADEVGFEEGDKINDIEFVDAEWWSGTNARTNERGLFPAAYVTLSSSADEALEEEDEKASDAAKESISAVAEYEYEKDEENEISFNEGDLIIDIEFVDDDWWSGTHSTTGEKGLFPANFVVLK